MRYKIISLILVFGALLAYGIFVYIQHTSLVSPSSKATVTLGGKVFSVEVAQTDTEREQGLSGHTPLTNDGGMLFVFPVAGTYAFWMKDMLFSLDIIWLDQSGKVVHIEKNLSPDTYPKAYAPGSPALYVLEISSGQAETLGLAVGDIAHIAF